MSAVTGSWVDDEGERIIIRPAEWCAFSRPVLASASFGRVSVHCPAIVLNPGTVGRKLSGATLALRPDTKPTTYGDGIMSVTQVSNASLHAQGLDEGLLRLRRVLPKPCIATLTKLAPLLLLLAAGGVTVCFGEVETGVLMLSVAFVGVLAIIVAPPGSCLARAFVVITEEAYPPFFWRLIKILVAFLPAIPAYLAENLIGMIALCTVVLCLVVGEVLGMDVIAILLRGFSGLALVGASLTMFFMNDRPDADFVVFLVAVLILVKGVSDWARSKTADFAECFKEAAKAKNETVPQRQLTATPDTATMNVETSAEKPRGDVDAVDSTWRSEASDASSEAMDRVNTSSSSVEVEMQRRLVASLQEAAVRKRNDALEVLREAFKVFVGEQFGTFKALVEEAATRTVDAMSRALGPEDLARNGDAAVLWFINVVDPQLLTLESRLVWLVHDTLEKGAQECRHGAAIVAERLMRFDEGLAIAERWLKPNVFGYLVNSAKVLDFSRNKIIEAANMAKAQLKEHLRSGLEDFTLSRMGAAEIRVKVAAMHREAARAESLLGKVERILHGETMKTLEANAPPGGMGTVPSELRSAVADISPLFQATVVALNTAVSSLETPLCINSFRDEAASPEKQNSPSSAARAMCCAQGSEVREQLTKAIAWLDQAKGFQDTIQSLASKCYDWMGDVATEQLQQMMGGAKRSDYINQAGRILRVAQDVVNAARVVHVEVDYMASWANSIVVEMERGANAGRLLIQELQSFRKRFHNAQSSEPAMASLEDDGELDEVVRKMSAEEERAPAQNPIATELTALQAKLIEFLQDAPIKSLVELEDMTSDTTKDFVELLDVALEDAIGEQELAGVVGDIFQLLDQDGDGIITAEEYQRYLQGAIPEKAEEPADHAEEREGNLLSPGIASIGQHSSASRASKSQSRTTPSSAKSDAPQVRFEPTDPIRCRPADPGDPVRPGSPAASTGTRHTFSGFSELFRDSAEPLNSKLSGDSGVELPAGIPPEFRSTRGLLPGMVRS